VRHFASTAFWRAYVRLPDTVRTLADRTKNYALLKQDPKHPSLPFKQVGRFWSVRIGVHYRALGIDVDEGVLWFWIGSHADYDRLIGSCAEDSTCAAHRSRSRRKRSLGTDTPPSARTRVSTTPVHS